MEDEICGTCNTRRRQEMDTKLYFGKSENNRPLARLASRWKNNMKKHLTGIAEGVPYTATIADLFFFPI
jgi:hypothetical protein